MIKNGLFTTHSPITRGEEPKPENQKSSKLAQRLKVISARLNNLLQARTEADKVYSNGYFENHYPKADKQVKNLLHEKVMLAHSRALNNDISPEEIKESAEPALLAPMELAHEEKEAKSKGVSITIAVGE